MHGLYYSYTGKRKRNHFFRTSKIPASLNPLVTISGRPWKCLYSLTSHFKWSGFTTDNNRGTGLIDVAESEYWFNIKFVYHSWNCFFMKSFAGFWIDKSIGCNLSVQFAGTNTGIIDFSFRKSIISSEIWALNTSKMHSDFCFSGRSRSSFTCSIYWRMTFFTYLKVRKLTAYSVYI